MNATMRSPDEMFKVAKDIMLEGREPTTEQDWQSIVNFWAANIQKELAPSATKLMCKIYQVPIDEEFVDKIVEFQLSTAEKNMRSI